MTADEASIRDARRRVLDAIAAAAGRVGRDPAGVRLVAVTKLVPAEVVVAALAAGCEDLGENRVQGAAAKIPLVGAAGRVGRDPAGVRLVAVTKQVPAEVVLAALAAGCEDLGENRVQEAAAKIPLIGASGPTGTAARWHLIGPLQSNKARRAVELFDVIEAVDSLEIAVRLDRLARELRPGRPLPVLLEINVDADPAKAGFRLVALEHDLEALLALSGLRVEGLMTVGRLVADAEAARPTFVALRSLSERLRGSHDGLGPALSMGMTDDFPVAVEEGATIVRIGRALFGERPHAP